MDQKSNTGQVEILGEFCKIYLYTHYTGDELVKIVYDTLRLKENLDDPEYLARMIFCRMIPPEKWYDNKDFGIGSQMYMNCEHMVTIDIERGLISIFNREEHHTDLYNLDVFINGFLDNANF
jgi:hypothetical protein